MTKRFEKYEAEGLTPEQMEEKEAQRRKRARSKSRQRKEAQLESKGKDFNCFYCQETLKTIKKIFEA